VLIDRVRLEGLTPAEADAIAILKGQLAEIRTIRQREREQPPAAP
jgi:hypothetical protein